MTKLMSEGLSLLGTYDAASVSASTVTTGWISAKNHLQFLAILATGVLGASATVDAKIQQAKDNSGTGAKDMTGKAITQIVKASGDNKQALINFKGADFDTEGGFCYFRLSITVGTAASIVGATLLGGAARFEPASAYNQTAVAQIV